jgi:hypothetical protein
MGQWNEQLPHWTQRLGSGTTHASVRASCLSRSDLNQSKVRLSREYVRQSDHSEGIRAAGPVSRRVGRSLPIGRIIDAGAVRTVSLLGDSVPVLTGH